MIHAFHQLGAIAGWLGELGITSAIQATPMPPPLEEEPELEPPLRSTGLE
jgi:hypothetical protein